LQFNAVTVPGDITGTWLAMNGVGLDICYTIASGSTLLGTANVWAATNHVGTMGSTNGVAATSDVFQLTGVVILPGIELPSATRAPLIMRAYDQESQTCKRYLRRIGPEGTGISNGTTGVFFFIRHDGMRVEPSAIMSAPLGITDIIGGNFLQSSAQVSINNNYPDFGLYSFSNFSGLTTGRVYMLQPQGLSPTPYLQLDGRL
jgi:hypothetical protein